VRLKSLSTLVILLSGCSCGSELWATPASQGSAASAGEPAEESPAASLGELERCEAIDVAVGLDISGIPLGQHRRGQIDFAQAESDASALAAALTRLFHGLRLGEVEPATIFRHGHEQEEETWLVEHAAGERLCGTRIVGLRYPNGTPALVMITLKIEGRILGRQEVEVQAWRSESDDWKFSTRLGTDIQSIWRLHRALAELEEHPDVPVRRFDGRGPKVSLFGSPSDQTLCIERRAEEGGELIIRCFRGLTPGSRLAASVRFVSNFVCIRADGFEWESGNGWLAEWPDGDIHRGICNDDNPRVAALAADVSRADPPFDLTPLHGVSVAQVNEQIKVLSAGFTQRACIRLAGRLACSGFWRWDEVSLANVTFRDGNVALENGQGWVVLKRHRQAAGGSHMGDEALVVFRVEGERLVQHGVLPLGGYSHERLAHEPEVQTTWETHSAAAGDIDLHRSGCLRVGPQRTNHRVRIDGQGERTTDRPGPRHPVAPDVHDGVDVDAAEVDAGEGDSAALLDTSGIWRFESDGGFRRVQNCPEN
jgi:hypothetical protein